MSERRKGGLGRGLGALIPSSASLHETDGITKDTSPETSGGASVVTEPSKPSPVAQEQQTGRVSANAIHDGPAEKAGEQTPVSRETKSRTPRSRPGRPVDFFFQPGSAEETDDTLEGDVSQSGINLDRLRATKNRSSTRKKKATVALPDTAASSFPTDQEGDGTVHAGHSSRGESADSEGVDNAIEESGLVQVPGARFAEIPTDSIRPNAKQPRSHFDEEEMDELVHSVKEIGVLQPIVVRVDNSGQAQFELVMGERRWRATQRAGLPTIPAIIRDTPDDDLLRDALLENLHRSQLNPLEEAAAYQQLLAEFGCSQEELSQRIGRSRPQISNTIRLMKLPPIVQLKVAAGTLTAGHARALLSLDQPALMVEMSQKIINEGLSVRATEELVSQHDGLRSGHPEKRKRAATPRHERLDYLATSLADRLDTNVKITLGARKGKVQIDFASVEDLNRIMDLLAQD